MTTTVTLRKILDRKVWEMMTPAPVTNAAGMFTINSTLADQLVMYVTSTTVIYLYSIPEDSWIQVPTSGLAGTFGAGSCGCYHPSGPTGTASAGGASTITTVLTTVGSLAGYTVRITGGTGAGQERTIASNTVGGNSVLTTTAAWTVNPDATSTYMILSGRFYVFVGNNATQGLRYYDVATNTWSAALSVTGVTATFVSDGRMKPTPGSGQSFATGTATAGGASTLTNSAKAWTTNQWTNSQVRITAGTGAGQVRTIASNTGTVLTTSAAWTANPDATSVYSIEGNDDHLYLVGNAAVAMFKYSISGNTWATLAPGVARSAAIGAGGSLNWIRSAPDATWTSENAIKNGRYLYSLRGGASTAMDVYDIAANSWSSPTYMRQTETFTTGSSVELVNGDIYIQKDATGRFFRFNVPSLTLDPWTTLVYPQGAATVGDKTWDGYYSDGGTVLRWIYTIRNTGTEVFRCLVI